MSAEMFHDLHLCAHSCLCGLMGVHLAKDRKIASSVAMNGIVPDESHRKWLKQLIHLAIAVGKRIEMDADFVEQRQVEIGQRRGLGELDVTPAFHSACRAAGDEDRQVRVVMHIGIADAAAVKIERMIQQCAVRLPAWPSTFARNSANSDTWN